MFNPQPKPLPKQPKTFGYDYWTKVRKKSAEKKAMKIKPISDRDEKFYAYIWKHHEHFCKECGKELTEFKRWYIHHLLPKARFPYFRWDENNVVVVCYHHHNECESATSYPKLKIYDWCEKKKKSLLESVGL